MTKIKPKLFVETGSSGAPTEINAGDSRVNSIYSETDGYSITPKTFISRSFLQDLDSEYFQDTYSCGQNSVMRFGLNIHSPSLIQEINSYNSPTIAKKGQLGLKSLAGSNNAETLLNDLKKEASNTLTTFEKTNTKVAIGSLKSGKKAVLVDIFDRDADGNIKIKVDNNSHQVIQTHTVVLYEQKGKYLVIDPNNANFSTILTGIDNDIRVCSGNKCVIYKKPAQADTGPNSWRDCIDVAAKLALSLFAHSKLTQNFEITVVELNNNLGHINFESLKAHPSIIDLTNNPDEICKKLPGIIGTIPFRIKQSSDIMSDKKITIALKSLVSVRDDIYAKLINLNFDHCKKVIDQKINNSLSSYNDIFQLVEELSSYTDSVLLGIETGEIQKEFGGVI